MISRLFLRTLNAISHANEITILHYCNKLVRFRLSHLINAIRTELTAQEDNGLGTLSIFRQFYLMSFFPFINLQNMNQMRTVSFPYKLPLYLTAVPCSLEHLCLHVYNFFF